MDPFQIEDDYFSVFEERQMDSFQLEDADPFSNLYASPSIEDYCLQTRFQMDEEEYSLWVSFSQ